MDDRYLTIGELARTTGVATSALRYWEELGLLPAPVRVAGQRRYPESAAGQVGAILLLRELGLSLRESKALLAADGWRAVLERKLADLDERIAKAQTARQAVAHALGCPHDDLTECPSFAAAIADRLAGKPLEELEPYGVRIKYVRASMDRR